jgi:hypothetical protein
MFYVVERCAWIACASETCRVFETRVYRSVEGSRNEGEGVLFARCELSSRLQGDTLGAPCGVIKGYRWPYVPGIYLLH